MPKNLPNTFLCLFKTSENHIQYLYFAILTLLKPWHGLFEICIYLPLCLSDEYQSFRKFTAVYHLVYLLEHLSIVLADNVLHHLLYFFYALLFQPQQTYQKNLTSHVFTELRQLVHLSVGGFFDFTHSYQDICDLVHTNIKLMRLLMTAVFQCFA